MYTTLFIGSLVEAKPGTQTVEELSYMDDTSLFSDESHILERIEKFRLESRLLLKDDIK